MRRSTSQKQAVRPRSSTGANSGATRLSMSRPKTSLSSSTISSRRSSQYGRDTYTKAKDPRPLSEKPYQTKLVREIITFLSENNYDHAVSVKTLLSPTTKEYLKVFAFIYSWLNTSKTYKTILEKKPEVEVPKILKSLGYPFTIQKTSLLNVGSPHTYPMLIGVLHWLMEIVKFSFQVRDNVDEYLFPMGESEEDFGSTDLAYESRVYFDYLERSYVAFLVECRELDDLEDYKNAFLDEIKSKNASTMSEMEQLAQGNLELEKELKVLQNEPSKLEALVEKRDSLQNDRAKFEEYIAELCRHRGKIDERYIQTDEELKGLKLEQEAAADEKAKLQKMLDNQELSVGDVQRMRKEKEQLKKTVVALKEQEDGLDQQLWESEMSYSKQHEQTLALCQDYNERARKLKLIPSTAGNAAGADYELKCHLGKMSLDFQSFLKPNLSRFKLQLSGGSRQCQSELFTLDERHDQIQELINEKGEEVSNYESQIAAAEKEYQWKKDILDGQHKKLTDKAEGMQEGVHDLRLESQALMKEMEKKQEEINDGKERLKKRTQEMEREKTQYNMFIDAACKVVIDHKTKIQNCLTEVRKDCEEYYEYMQKVPTVSSKLLKE